LKTLSKMTWKRPRKFKDGRRAVVERLGYGENWPRQRARALRRDGYTCKKCGHVGRKATKKGSRYDVFVHHRRKISWYVKDGAIDYEAANDLENLVTLCNVCHKVADSHKPLKGFRMVH